MQPDWCDAADATCKVCFGCAVPCGNVCVQLPSSWQWATPMIFSDLLTTQLPATLVMHDAWSQQPAARDLKHSCMPTRHRVFLQALRRMANQGNAEVSLHGRGAAAQGDGIADSPVHLVVRVDAPSW